MSKCWKCNKEFYSENLSRTLCDECLERIPRATATTDFVNLLNTEMYELKIADLEAKLVESEKKFNVANNLRKNSDEVLLNYKTEKYGLDKTIQELRKIKLSLPEKEWYYKGFENCERQMSSHIADLTLEVKQLAEKEKENLVLYSMLYETLEKQGCENVASAIDQMTGMILDKQADWFKGNRNCAELLKLLAEKEKELKYKTAECEKWKTDYKNCSELEKIISKERQYCLDNWRASEQDKISFAVERLVGVQKYISDNAVYVEEETFGREINGYIDNQIKQLKKGK